MRKTSDCAGRFLDILTTMRMMSSMTNQNDVLERIARAFERGDLLKRGSALHPKDPLVWEVRPGQFPELSAIGLLPTEMTPQRCRALLTTLLYNGPEACAAQVGGTRSVRALVPELRGLRWPERAVEFSKRWEEHCKTGARALTAQPVQGAANPLKQADVDFSGRGPYTEK